MIRKCLMGTVVGLTLTAIIATTMAAEAAKEKRGGRKGLARRGETGWHLSVQTYTWNRVTFSESIDRGKEVGVKFLEGFAWQKLSPETGDMKLDGDASDEAIKKTQEKLKQAGIRLVNYYVSDWGKDEAAHKKIFEFAKKMGIRTFVAEPDAKLLDVLEPLCKEYKVRIAIHNHPKNAKDEHYTNWNPENVMKMLEGRSKAIGTCADTGHWVRAGLDPVECLKKYEDRLICLHLKDVSEKSAEGHDVPFGTGVSNVKGQLQELARQKFNGVIAIEYENNMENNVGDVKQCVEFFNKTAQEIGNKVASR